MKHVPISLFLLIAGCASAPPGSVPAPHVDAPPPMKWDGGGGAAALRERGEELADLALRLRGAPYRYGGATREGFDCSGLVFYSHRQLGVAVPRTSREQAED